MNKQKTAFNWSWLVSIALGVAALLLVFAFLTGRQVPLVVDERTAFIALAAVGFAMCSFGIRQVANRLGWKHPITIAGAVLGSLLMLFIIAVLAGWQIPYIADYRTAFMVLAVIALVKWALAWTTRLRFGV